MANETTQQDEKHARITSNKPDDQSICIDDVTLIVEFNSNVVIGFIYGS